MAPFNEDYPGLVTYSFIHSLTHSLIINSTNIYLASTSAISRLIGKTVKIAALMEFR